MLGRFSGNKFGIVLNNCTPDDMAMAAERLLAGVRDDVVQTAPGPVAVTVTIGGVTAPRHARTRRRDPRARAGSARHAPRPSGAARSSPIGRTSSARRCAARTCAPPTRSSPRSTSGASCSPSSRWSRRRRAQPAFYECLMRIRRADGSARAGERGDPGRRAARPGAPARSSRARAGRRRARRRADAAGERQRLAGLDHRSGLVGGARRAAARASRRRASG